MCESSLSRFGILGPGSQREEWQHGAAESQGRESGADISRAQEKGVLYSCRSAKQSADTMQKFPA